MNYGLAIAAVGLVLSSALALPAGPLGYCDGSAPEVVECTFAVRVWGGGINDIYLTGGMISFAGHDRFAGFAEVSAYQLFSPYQEAHSICYGAQSSGICAPTTTTIPGGQSGSMVIVSGWLFVHARVTSGEGAWQAAIEEVRVPTI